MGLANQKPKESNERILVDWEPEKARRHLSRFIIPLWLSFLPAITLFKKT